jgi:hypothetical protein
MRCAISAPRKHESPESHAGRSRVQRPASSPTLRVYAGRKHDFLGEQFPRDFSLRPAGLLPPACPLRSATRRPGRHAATMIAANTDKANYTVSLTSLALSRRPARYITQQGWIASSDPETSISFARTSTFHNAGTAICWPTVHVASRTPSAKRAEDLIWSLIAPVCITWQTSPFPGDVGVRARCV